MFHIVDDNDALREMLVEVLGELGHAACSFSSAVEYLDFMGTADYERPIAIFTDVRMPDMNGFELMTRVQSYYSDMRFVVISGYTDNLSDKVSEACLILPKPFQIEFLDKITELLSRCYHGQMDGLLCNQVKELKPLYPDDWQCPHQSTCCTCV